MEIYARGKHGGSSKKRTQRLLPYLKFLSTNNQKRLKNKRNKETFVAK